MPSKAPVILVHGMWTTPESLKEVKAAFEEQGYRVHAPCLPYHLPKNQLRGEAGKRLAQTGIEDYVAAIGKCIEQLDQKPILVGHSMGGLIAQLVATRHECQGLILISSAPPAGMNGFSWSVMRTLGRNLFLFPMWKKTTRLLLRNVQYGIANTQSADIHRDIIQMSTLESGRATWQIAMWFLFRRPPTRVNFNQINCPVLLIGGTEDKITPLKIQKALKKRYAGKSVLKVIQGACHWTVGGSYFPEIKQILFSWLNEQNALKGSVQ